MIEMTLAEAQALECNGCGDCCDSRSALMWHWGDAPDLFRHLNDGAPLIIPLREVHEGYLEAAGSGRPVKPGRPHFVGAFACAALGHEDEAGRRPCALYARERPPVCGEFPIFGSFGDDIWMALLTVDRVEIPAMQHLPRCTWYDVVIVAPEGR